MLCCLRTDDIAPNEGAVLQVGHVAEGLSKQCQVGGALQGFAGIWTGRGLKVFTYVAWRYRALCVALCRMSQAGLRKQCNMGGALQGSGQAGG